MIQNDNAQQQGLLRARQRLDRLAWLLDDSIQVPGTNRRFGLDPILGLVPGVGDVIGAGLSLYLMVEAARLGAPNRLLLQMLGNTLVETVVGLVPVLGDLFDFYWKANSRNRELLAGHIDGRLQPAQDRTGRLALWLLAGAVLVLILLLFPDRLAGL